MRINNQQHEKWITLLKVIKRVCWFVEFTALIDNLLFTSDPFQSNQIKSNQRQYKRDTPKKCSLDFILSLLFRFYLLLVVIHVSLFFNSFFCNSIIHANGCLPRSFWFKYFLHGSVCCTIIFFSIKFFVVLDLMVSDDWCCSCCCCCNWCCCFVIASLIVDLMLFDAIDGFLSLFDAPPVG